MKKLNPIYQLGRLWARINYKNDLRKFRSECQRAENLSAENNGKRFRVFRSAGGGYAALSGDNIHFLKNRKLMDKRINTGLLSAHCLYDTMTHSNLHPAYLNVDLKVKYNCKKRGNKK